MTQDISELPIEDYLPDLFGQDGYAEEFRAEVGKAREKIESTEEEVDVYAYGKEKIAELEEKTRTKVKKISYALRGKSCDGSSTGSFKGKNSRDVETALKKLQEEGIEGDHEITAQELFLAMMQAGIDLRDKIRSHIATGEFPFELIRGIGREVSPDEIESQYAWLLEDEFLRKTTEELWAHCAGVVQVSYEELHQKEVYNFMTEETPSHLCKRLLQSEGGFFDGEEIDGEWLEIGPGSGRDSREMLERKAGITKIRAVDISKHALEKCRRTRESLPTSLKDKWEIPEEPKSMEDTMDEMIERGETVNGILTLSNVHYTNEAEFFENLVRMNRILPEEPGGKLCIGVKLEGSSLMDFGIPVRNIADSEGDEEESTREKVTFSPDGIYRRSTPKPRYEHLLKAAGFCVKEMTIQSEPNYENEAQGEVKMLYIAARKLSHKDRPTGITQFTPGTTEYEERISGFGTLGRPIRKSGEC